MMMQSPIGRPSCDRSCEAKEPSMTHAFPCLRARRAHLDIVALVVVAALAEQAVLDDSVDVELVEDGVGVLGQRCGEDDDLVDVAHRLQECCKLRRCVSR